MTEREREVRREYYRKWRKAHPDRVRAHNEAYWRRKVAELNAREEKAGKVAD